MSVSVHAGIHPPRHTPPLGRHPAPRQTTPGTRPLQRTVRILLECFLVSTVFFNSRERNETTEANRLCTECKRDFCEQCAQRHSSVPAFKQHSVIAMPTGNMASLRYCGSHSDELLMYNCLTCDQFVCSLCITDTHNTCEVHSVSEVGTHIRPFVKD